MYPTSFKGRFIAVFSLVVALLLLGCTDTVGVTSFSDDATAERRAQYRLSVSPGNHSAFVGDSVQYVLTVTDRYGRALPAGNTTWRVSDGRIAQISSTGTVVALAVGTANVTAASSYGDQRTVPITVTAREDDPPPDEDKPTVPTVPVASGSEPTFNASANQSLWHDDFESALTTASIYTRYATQSAEIGLHLDFSGGLNGSRGMRIEWQPRSGCSDDSHFIEGSFAAAQEVVVQYSVRYQTNFAFDWIGRGGACSGNAKKLFFLWAAAGSRFDFISENHVLGVGSDFDHPLFAQHLGTAVTPEALGDGQWHRITLRVRQSSTPTATDGYVHGWIDGVQKWSVNNIASRASGGWVLFKVPSTFNQGSPLQQSEWMDDFRIWRP